MMFRYLNTLHGRLALALFISFTIIGIFSSSLFIQSSQAYQNEITQRMHKDLAKHVAKHYLLFEDGKPNLEVAKHTFHELMILGPNFEFYLLDKKGKILAYSTKPHKIKRKSVSIEPIKEFLQLKSLTHPMYGNDPRSHTKNKIFSASKIEKEGKIDGYLYVILGSEIYDDVSDVVFHSKILQWGLWIFAIGLAFSLLATLWLTGVITRPLSKLTSEVMKIRDIGFKCSGKDFEATTNELTSWKKNNVTEIHVLGSAFKELIDILREQYDNVITADELRRELLSHVSHDLRSPLASLLGYLETWEIKHENVSKEESVEYIAIAKNSAEKISNLIEQLFELAHLDSGNVKINLEQFSIAELAHDVMQKFKIAATEKQVSLNVEPPNINMTVVGDIEKLDRVLTNLIENAIRHCEPESSVTIRLTQDARFVAVEIIDTGVGIPPKDLPFVFDPHFKAGNSVRGNTAHGGLGLAITKKLLGLHQSTIEVVSEENKGTTFSFNLQVA